MLFTSYEFLFFLIITLLLYYIIPSKMQWVFLLGASYFFYFMAGHGYLLYIVITTITIWFTAYKIDLLNGKQKNILWRIRKRKQRKR